MKFVLMFVGSVLVVGSHQYLHDQRREMPWVSPYPAQPFIEKHQPVIVYFSKPHQPMVYSLHDLLLENEPEDARLFYAGDTENIDEPHNHRNVPESQPRGKISFDEPTARFFFGIEPTIFSNPFVRTTTFTVAATLTVSSIIRCIPVAQFLAVANQGISCGRKRRFLELLETPESHQTAIAPSEPQLLTTASVPSIDLLQDSRLQPSDQQTHHEIVSSKEENWPKSSSSYANLKNKRFVFFQNKNVYVSSTTVTTYNFLTTVSTSTINLGNAAQVLCLPVGYRVC